MDLSVVAQRTPGFVGADLGPITYGKRQQSQYLGVEFQEEKNYSEETAKRIDAEVNRLIDESYREAKSILETKKASLIALSGKLMEKEVLTGEEINKLLENKN